MPRYLAMLLPLALIAGCNQPFECDFRGHIIVNDDDSLSRKNEAMLRNVRLEAARREADSKGGWVDSDRLKRAEGCGS